MDAKALKGMAVVSLQEGTKLGVIDQLLFNVLTAAVVGVGVVGLLRSIG